MTKSVAVKRMFTPTKSLFVLLSVIAFSACSTPNEPEIFPEVTFDHLGRLSVGAAMVDVQMVYRPPLRSPNVEHLAPVSFQTAVDRWADRRFITQADSENRVVVKIKDASITEKTLPTRSGVRGALEKEQEFEYESVLDVSIQIIGLNDKVLSEFTPRVWQRRTLIEDASPYEKRMLWLSMVEGAVTELDAQLAPRLRAYFGSNIQ